MDTEMYAQDAENPPTVVIHTGNFGCGAFGNNRVSTIIEKK